MRYARVFVLALAVVVAVVIAAVAVLPSVLNWNRYRAEFEILAGDALGRPVTIAGPISLSLLPEPVLTASRVRVGGGDDGARITVPELRLQVALMPLLSGQVDARALTLRNPDLRLPWPPRLGLPFTTPPWLAALSAEIDEGTIEVGTLRLTHVNATLTAGRGDAALDLAGSAAMGKSSWRLTLRLGEPESDGAAPVEASLTGADAVAGAVAKFAGQLSPGGRVTGHLALDGPDLSRLAAAPALPFHADSTLTLSAGYAGLGDLNVTLGEMAATGAGTFVLQPAPRLDLALASTGIVALDPWLAALRLGGESRLPIGVALSAPRATLARGLLQNLKLAMVLQPGGARIGAFQAILPGEASLHAAGRIDHASGKDGAWQFVGTASLAAPALRTTLHWLEAAAQGVLPHLPPTVLREAKISARVTVGGGEMALDDLSGTVDGDQLSGGLSLGLGDRPAISAGLTFERLDLSPWLPERPPSLVAMGKLFGSGSVELRLSVHQAELGRTEVSGLTLDAAAESGQVVLRRLDATIEGLHAIASGTLGRDGTVTAGRLVVTAPNPRLLAQIFPAPFGKALGRWQAPFSLGATAGGSPSHLAITIDATLGDLRLTAAPMVDLPNRSWRGTLTLRHPGAAQLIAASGLPDRDGWPGPGSFSLIGQIAGTPGGWSLDGLRLVAGALTASGQLHFAEEPAGPRVDGAIQASTLPVLLPSATDTEPLSLGFLSEWHGTIGLEADKVLAGNRLMLSNARGRVSADGHAVVIEAHADPPGGGSFAAVLRFDPTGEVPHATLGGAFSGVVLQGGLFGTALDLEQGTLAGKFALSGQGYSAAAMLATLGGTVELSGRGGVLGGINLLQVHAALASRETAKTEPMLLTALSGGSSSFARLDVVAHGAQGRFTLNRAQMQADEGTITASGTLDVPARGMDLRLTLTPAIGGAPPVVVRLAGSAARPKRLTEVTEALQWLAKQPEPAAGPRK